MKKIWFTLYFLNILCSFDMMTNYLTHFFRRNHHFSFLSEQIKRFLPVMTVGLGFSLIGERPYRMTFLLGGLYFLYLKRNKELQDSLTKTHAEELDKLKYEHEIITKKAATEKENSATTIANLEARMTTLLEELKRKEDRRLLTEEENLLHKNDDRIIQSLRMQNVQLLKVLYENCQKQDEQRFIKREANFPWLVTNALLSSLFFYKKKKPQVR